ncbi:hypothetical protein K2X33_05590 [bacterium]|nr:hypothetical protein [bacterium]
MAKQPAQERFPELREFIKGNDQRVSDFCACLLPADQFRQELVLEIFREFGEDYRAQAAAPQEGAAPDALLVTLFQIAWKHVQQSQSHAYFPMVTGRDTRILQELDANLLAAQPLYEKTRERLLRVDPELRATVVLRDILGFTDEQSAAVLGLRWGVYRHRLHRGRLDFKDALKGLPRGAAENTASA